MRLCNNFRLFRALALTLPFLLPACQGTAPTPQRPPVQAPALPPVAPPAEPVPPASAPLPPVASSDDATQPFQPVANRPVKIRLWTALRDLTLTLTAPADKLAPGTYTVRVTGAKPATQSFHLFVKTFPVDKPGEAEAYLADWRAKGYPAQLETLGNQFRDERGVVLENRLHYVSLNRFPTRALAEQAKARLESQGQWSWIEVAADRPGSGTATFAAVGGKSVLLPVPCVVRCPQPVAVSGRTASAVKGTYSGDLEVRVGPDGLMELYEIIDVEEYLEGVLPAEMPALWPAEALKAQALAARSEVYANWGVKHKLEGFQYCASEHCRAYNGHGGRHPNSDAAVEATRGLVLTDGRQVVPTVFSANCGGWTESNDNVWSSPPNPALRGLGDFPVAGNPAPRGPVALGMSAWLGRKPSAYCSADAANYRWTKRFSAAELSAIVNRSYKVGAIKDIRLGERGVSGRLKSVEIVGTQKTVKVAKELPIRQAFGGLPSAMFILDVKRGAKGPSEFVFTGGGRGHGVGLCQQGAKGMAARGLPAKAIVEHYFQATRVTRIQ